MACFSYLIFFRPVIMSKTSRPTQPNSLTGGTNRFVAVSFARSDSFFHYRCRKRTSQVSLWCMRWKINTIAVCLCVDKIGTATSAAKVSGQCIFSPVRRKNTGRETHSCSRAFITHCGGSCLIGVDCFDLNFAHLRLGFHCASLFDDCIWGFRFRAV